MLTSRRPVCDESGRAAAWATTAHLAVRWHAFHRPRPRERARARQRRRPTRRDHGRLSSAASGDLLMLFLPDGAGPVAADRLAARLRLSGPGHVVPQRPQAELAIHERALGPVPDRAAPGRQPHSVEVPVFADRRAPATWDERPRAAVGPMDRPPEVWSTVWPMAPTTGQSQRS